MFVANPGPGYVCVLNGRAEAVEILRGLAGASTTSQAFGGPGQRMLHVSDSTHGHVLRAPMDAPGPPLIRP